jgi:hypothetical protein
VYRHRFHFNYVSFELLAASDRLNSRSRRGEFGGKLVGQFVCLAKVSGRPAAMDVFTTPKRNNTGRDVTHSSSHDESRSSALITGPDGSVVGIRETRVEETCEQVAC